MLAERFRESGTERTPNTSIVVLPFANLGATKVAPLYGFALADAIAARLARIPALVVRPSSTLMPPIAQPIAHMDPLAVGQKLMVSLVLAGNFVRSDFLRFELAIARCVITKRAHRRSDPRGASLDLVAVQTEISNEVFATLHGLAPPSEENRRRRRQRGRPCGMVRSAGR